MKVGSTFFFANVSEYEARIVTGDYSKDYPVSDHQRYQEELYLADLVEPLGFDSLWTIEHHFSPYGMTNNPVTLLSYFAARTKKIDLGSMVMVLPWHEPLNVAEDISMLDNLLAGRRFWVGMGRGFAAREFNALRIPYEDSRERLEEIIEITRLGLTEEFFQYQGEIFDIPRTTIRPRPLSPNITERLMMVWASEESLEIAAHAGLAPLFTNYIGHDSLVQQVKRFGEIRASHGWDPIPSTVSTTIYCHEDQEYAEERGTEHWKKTTDTTFWHYDRAGRQDWLPDLDQEEKKAFLEKRYADNAYAGFFGTPENLIERLSELQKDADIGHLITCHSYGVMPQEEKVRSMRKFAAECVPALKQIPTKEIWATPYSDVVSNRALNA